MTLFVATHHLLDLATYPLHCAKVDVRTHFRKGSMGRELAIHYFSQGHPRKHPAPPSFSRGTELHDHATLSVPRPSDAVPHAVPQSPSKNQADHEWPHTADLRTDLFVNKLLRPSPTPGRNRIPQSVATHACTRDTVRGGAVATGVPHPLMGDGCALLARSSRIVRHDGARFHLARRLRTRCLSKHSSATPPLCRPW